MAHAATAGGLSVKQVQLTWRVRWRTPPNKTSHILGSDVVGRSCWSEKPEAVFSITPSQQKKIKTCIMKKVNGKYIRLTEAELHHLIKDEIKKVIPLILEYALPRQKFVENCFNLLQQICENWCLIRYSRLIGDDNISINHWKSELKAHMKNISKTKIKKNDSVPSRMSAISEAFDWSDLDKSERKVQKYIEIKFSKEGYRTDEHEPYVTVWFDFKHEVKTLTILMANSNNNDIDEYVDSL